MKKLTFLQMLCEMKKIGGALGSTPGGIHIDDDGKKAYVKYYGKRGTPDQAYVEVAASNVYELLQAKTVKPRLIDFEGDKAVLSDWDEDLEDIEPAEFDKFNVEDDYDLAKHYIAAVLTKNWDSVGLEYDNIRRNKKTGKLVTVDTGGTFHFRAMGGSKEYSTDASELKSLRDNDGSSGRVFGEMFKRHQNEGKFLEPVLELLKNIPDRKFESAIYDTGMSEDLADMLFENLLKRKKAILRYYNM